MESIYQKALGADFHNLHPAIRRRFGLTSRDNTASIGTGMMEYVRYSKPAAPFLWLGSLRHILVPRSGENVPFSIENYAYTDGYGRETVTWNRSFRFPGAICRFDATMIYSERRGKIIDYLGNRQHLAVDIDIKADDQGGIRIHSGEQRFYEGWLGVRFPMALSGVANVREWFDESLDKYRIHVHVQNRWYGTLFEYRGLFDVEYREMQGDKLPLDAKPLREEIRD